MQSLNFDTAQVSCGNIHDLDWLQILLSCRYIQQVLTKNLTKFCQVGHEIFSKQLTLIFVDQNIKTHLLWSVKT